MNCGRLENRFFTLPLATAAERKDVRGGRAGSSNDAMVPADNGRKRELDTELEAVKKIRKQLNDAVRDVRRAGKGGGGGRGGGKGFQALPPPPPSTIGASRRGCQADR